MVLLILGGKVIKVEVLNEKGVRILETDKNFVLPRSMSDEDSIVMIKGRYLPELDYNQIVSVVTTTKGNDRIKYTGAVTMSIDTQLNIRILRNNDSQVLQERRRYYKIKVDEAGRILSVLRGEESQTLDLPARIKVLDINVGGVFMTCEQMEFEKQDIITLEVDLAHETLISEAKILRVQHAEDGSILGYGCEFQGLTAAQEDVISRFIIKVQSKLRQQEADKNDLTKI
ncbi:MAG: PilZ domain-containing protein [Oscillospiraceae bacterium]|nr:PilZ domain-containing protein [Oscillospiraceae bacterium]